MITKIFREKNTAISGAVKIIVMINRRPLFRKRHNMTFVLIKLVVFDHKMCCNLYHI